MRLPVLLTVALLAIALVAIAAEVVEENLGALTNSHLASEEAIEGGDIDEDPAPVPEQTRGPIPIGQALVADIDHDGLPDFVYTRAGSDGVFVALGKLVDEDDASPVLVAEDEEDVDVFPHVVDDGGHAFVILDEDSDGWDDVVVLITDVETDMSRLELHRNISGQIDIVALKSVSVPSPAASVCTADYNDDGVQDLVVTHGSGQLSIIEGGSSWSATTYSIGGNPIDAYDLAELEPNATGVLVLSQEESGSSILKVTSGPAGPSVENITNDFSHIKAGDIVRSLWFFDYEGDGDRDLAVLRFKDGDINDTVADLYLCPVLGVYTRKSSTTLRVPLHWIRVVDSNSDGFMDLVSATANYAATCPIMEFELATGSPAGFQQTPSPIDIETGYNLTTTIGAGTAPGCVAMFCDISWGINCGKYSNLKLFSNATAAEKQKICAVVDLLKAFAAGLSAEGNACHGLVNCIADELKDLKDNDNLAIADMDSVDGWANPLWDAVMLDRAMVTAAAGCDPTDPDFWRLVTVMVHEASHSKDGVGTSEYKATEDAIKVLKLMLEDLQRVCDNNATTVSILKPLLDDANGWGTITWQGGGNIWTILKNIRREKWREKRYQIDSTWNYLYLVTLTTCQDAVSPNNNNWKKRDRQIARLNASKVGTGVTNFTSTPVLPLKPGVCRVRYSFEFCGYKETREKVLDLRVLDAFPQGA